MSSHLAEILQPYVSYLFIGQLFLIAVALILGMVIFFRIKLKKQGVESDLSMDAEGIAAELSAEIERLEKLKKRLSSGEKIEKTAEIPLAAVASSPDKVVEKTQEPSIPVTGSVSDDALAPVVAPVVPQVNVAEIEANVEKKFQDKLIQLQGQIQTLEQSLKLSKEQNEKMAVVAPAASVEAPIDTKASGELQAKVETLERMLSEYKIFEEDFALVKKYKTENERLKRQLTETHKLTEADIDTLFQNINETADPAAVVSNPDPALKDDDFFSVDELMFAEKAAAVAPAIEPPSPVSAPAPMVSARTPTPPAAEVRVPEPVSAPGPSPEDFEAALRGAETFDVEPVKKDPEVKAPPKEAASLEDMAESAVNDDELMAEFQKLLGEQNS